MEIQKKEINNVKALKYFVEKDGKEVGRAYVYIIKNDLHVDPYGLLEDIFVDESARGGGLGTELLKQAIAGAKEAGCYKFVSTSRKSRENIHAWYRKNGFEEYGLEFRITF
ncbi:MAG: GNAT family N-acetyltransferase [Candidatus Magasanikbacteria bacterium CG_4_10_14_0_8_um_filter_32_14]|uniref:GNAT family N-acetyltransferase n=2 Tax=Candidatus Magasanikiibacteriota TaxID=1752731 RepID=A0A2M7R901_9BACT|nr:MAG: GNAT family N-acetyltransferase [Candidatus Magasanikbacteria bacterium CG1_02_32_51]PIY93238.1 MAG: GNAT family N-acetyltransferase [Candidatus Magasanikbacteria bacterium CG_4_10_14_0_8_um_filter_32_14]